MLERLWNGAGTNEASTSFLPIGGRFSIQLRTTASIPLHSVQDVLVFPVALT